MKKVVHGPKPAPASLLGDINRQKPGKTAFSLVEMLMALLVASLLLAALAPVMTRKLGENIGITVEGEIPGQKTHTHEIKYANDDTCASIEEKDGYSICKGAFTVPTGYNGPLYVTATGGGGGGGTSATSGTIDFTVSSTGQQSYDFTVPAGVTELEVTMVSGGAGGGAGGLEAVTVSEISAKTGGVYTWSVPDVVKNKNVLAWGCGGGGGGGGTVMLNTYGPITTQGMGNGGNGGYRVEASAKVVKIPNIVSVAYQIGGGGGGGGDGGGGCQHVNPGKAGNCGGGGDGGSDDGAVVTNTCNPAYGGTSGATEVCTPVTTGGGGGVLSDGVSRAGSVNGYVISGATLGGNIAAGGTGSSGGNGGASGKPNANWARAYAYSGGGGGGYFGGGGGGGGCTGTGGGGGGPTYFYNTLIASGGGGGGGGSHARAYAGGDYWNCPGGGGGGGGGLGGGQGGAGANVYTTYEYVVYGSNGAAGSPATTAALPSGRCAGGIGGRVGGTRAQVKGTTGSDGILYVKYLDKKIGGSGGGGGQIVPKQRIKVTPGETLTVFVGRGGKGTTAGYISDAGAIVSPDRAACVAGDANMESKISRGSTILLRTAPEGRGAGTCGGDSLGRSLGMKVSPYSACQGYVSNGVNYVGYQDHVDGIEGFSSTDGKAASGLNGGAGGTTTIFGNITCTPGAGGTSTSVNGKKGTGYGCGGGGGAPFGNGGDGTDGLVRITWNPDRVGYGGGGGGAATVVKKSINVSSGAVYRYQIASGGKGGEMVIEGGKQVIRDGYYGGDTIFGTNVSRNKISVGGGSGGKSVGYTGAVPDITTINGAGGAKATLCKVDSTALTCSSAFESGVAGSETNGGGSGGKSHYGAGAAGSKNTAGKNAANIGSGGGASGIREAGGLNDYPYDGGKGAEGKIILEWYE